MGTHLRAMHRGEAGEDLDVQGETSIMWTDSVWLNIQPGGLRPENVLAYFLMSSFADARCLNNIARDRGLTKEQVADIAPSIEYTLAFAQPAADGQEDSLFILERQKRIKPRGPQKVTAVYYILNGSVFRAPGAYSILASCLVQAAT